MRGLGGLCTIWSVISAFFIFLSFLVLLYTSYIPIFQHIKDLREIN